MRTSIAIGAAVFGVITAAQGAFGFAGAQQDLAIASVARAIENGTPPDLDAAIAQNPRDAEAHYARGLINYWKRDWKAASTDLAIAHKAHPKDPETAMWRALAQVRNHEPLVVADFKEIDKRTWPGAAVWSLIGENIRLQDHVEIAAKTNDPKAAQVACDAAFVQFAQIQSLNAVEKMEAARKHTGGLSYKASVKTVLEQSCGQHTFQRLIGLREIESLTPP